MADSEVDRADRLSSRRHERSEHNESDARDQRDEADEPDESVSATDTDSSDASDSSDESVSPVKDIYEGAYIYLPAELKTEYDLVAGELDMQRRRRNGKELEKTRHYQPMLIQLGLDRLDAMSDEEVEALTERFDP